jgi:methylenetetrahydrofolate dehydrogenase (NADP+) / methenyltetrahydrofolate cyclohydrolase
MNRATIIDGKLIAQGLRNTIAKHTANLLTQGIKPGLAVVLVGEDPASQVYVRNKHQQSIEVGFNSFEHRLSASTSQAELLAVVERLNNDANVHGILVQLPLPKHIAEQAVLNAIHPDKDVDGFHPVNAGRLAIGKPLFAPCTPVGCEILVRSVLPNLSGAHAVIIGRSNIVGKPVAQLLLAANCTVTITHSHTKNLPELVKQADVVIAAIGKPNFVRGAWLKPGAIVIDVGINRVPDEREGAAPGKTRLIGDVDFDEAMQVASAVTPVPGGVGPMTIACLLRSTFIAACQASKHPIPSDL